MLSVLDPKTPHYKRLYELWSNLIRNIRCFVSRDTKDKNNATHQKIKSAHGAMREKHSLNDGDNLTDWEMSYLTVFKCCPDCKTGELMEGPQAGMSVNFTCTKCTSKFNLSIDGGTIIFAQRISDSSLKKAA